MSVHEPESHIRDDDDEFARNFRRTVLDRKSRQGSGSPMTGFRVRNRFRPPVGDATWIRVLRENHIGMDGQPVPYYEYYEHFNAAVQKGTICSKIWKELPDGSMEGSGKCIPCHLIEEGATSISHRRLTAFLVLSLDWFYQVPALDRKGNIQTRQRDSKFYKKGDTIYDRIPEDEAIEKFGRMELRRGNYEKVFGKLLHWSMGINHLTALSGRVDDLERQCCCGGELTTPLWECAKCGAEFYDRSSDGGCDLTEKEVRDRVMRPELCQCGNKALLKPVRDCDSCRDPKPLKLWDVDIYVGREGTGAQSQLIVHRHKHRELDERCIDLLPKRNLLNRIFAGDKIEYQADKMKVPNPWRKESFEHVQDYDDPKEVEDDDIPM